MKFSIVSAFALPLLASAASVTHKVTVGSGGDVFTPSTITANVGDVVEFSFAASGHAVAQGVFGTGCSPASNAFWTGADIASGKTWSITVDTKNPIPFYCSTPYHCSSGMVGVINPKGKKSLAAYKKSAGSAGAGTAPSTVQGGTF